MIRDAEALVTAYLKTQDIGAIVVGETPRDTGQAWVKVSQIAVRTVGNENEDYFHNYHLQLDCYAGEDGPNGQGQASDIFRAVRAAMQGMPAAVDGVTAVRFGAAIRLPDNAFSQPRQRFALDCFVYAKTT